MPPEENTYDLFITDAERNIIQESRSMGFDAAEKVIRDYPWQEKLRSNLQIWKPNTTFSFSLHYMEETKNFRVGFSDKASRFKLPLPYVGASYGLFDRMDDVIASLHLFFTGEFGKLEQFLTKHRPRITGDRR